MVTRLCLLLLFVAGCAASQQNLPAAQSPFSPNPRKAAAQQALASSVRIFIDDGKQSVRSGSGVVIGSRGTPSGRELFVLTNAHLLDPTGIKAPGLRVVAEIDGESFEYAAEVFAAGKRADQDLALLRVRGVEVPAAEVAGTEELKVGEDVVVVGAAFGQAPSVSGGMISLVQRDPKLREPNLLKTDAAVAYGSAGAGVFSASSGRLLGLVEGYRTTRVAFAVENQDYAFELPMPGETFVAPASKIRHFLAEQGLEGLLAGSSGAVRAEAH